MTAQQAKQLVKNALYRTIGETSTSLRLAPNGNRTLRVLMYHKVNDIPDNPTTVPVSHFDEQMRRRAAPDSLFVSEGWSAVLWRPDDGEVEPLVARMRRLPGHVEWKYYSHDGPELRERLVAAGLEPDDEETVVVAEAASIPPPPADLELREDVDAVQALALEGKIAGDIAALIGMSGVVCKQAVQKYPAD